MDLIKVNAEEYNLKEKKAKEIAAIYVPMINMLTEMEADYNHLVALKVTEEVAAQAKRMRLDIAQVRLNGDKARKAAKDEYLRAGNAIQGAYNTLLYAVKSKEDKLLEIENHFENMEDERLEKLQTERAKKVEAYVEEGAILPDLSTMDEDVFTNYVAGMKVAHEAKIQAEQQAVEAEAEAKRVENLKQTRSKLLTPYYQFMDDHDIFETLGQLNNEEWNQLVTNLEAEKNAYDKEQERIKLENEKLKKEAEELRKKREKEEEQRQKEEQLREAKRLDEKKKLEDEAEAKRLLHEKEMLAEKAKYEEEERLAEIERKKQRDAELEKQMKAEAEAKKKLHAEIAERQKVEAELQAKKEAEQKEADAALKKLQDDLNRGDTDKVASLVEDLTLLKTKYVFKSAKNKNTYLDVGLLIEKIIEHIEK